MDARKSENERLPLDQIRQAESEATRRIAAAHEKAKQMLEDARVHAAQIKSQAREAGLSAGRQQYTQIVANAEEQASMLITQANQLAENLRRTGEQRIDEAIRYALGVIIGLKGENDGN
jgi:vacuolar-type H+-ATPase subunit H